MINLCVESPADRVYDTKQARLWDLKRQSSMSKSIHSSRTPQRQLRKPQDGPGSREDIHGVNNGLGASWDPPGRAGEPGHGERDLGYLALPAAEAIRTWIICGNGWMDGYMSSLSPCVVFLQFCSISYFLQYRQVSTRVYYVFILTLDRTHSPIAGHLPTPCLPDWLLTGRPTQRHEMGQIKLFNSFIVRSFTAHDHGFIRDSKLCIYITAHMPNCGLMFVMQ